MGEPRRPFRVAASGWPNESRFLPKEDWIPLADKPVFIHRSGDSCGTALLSYGLIPFAPGIEVRE